MARKKYTAAQRKAKKQQSYVRSEYIKTFDALMYLKNFTKVKDVKMPEYKITKASLKAIRKLYKETRKKVKKTEGLYMDVSTGEAFKKLPSKKELQKLYKEEQTYKAKFTTQEAPADFNPDVFYLESLISTLSSLKGVDDKSKTERNYTRNVAPKLQDATDRMIAKIRYAATKLGTAGAAALLAASPYITRIENLKEKYAYEIIVEINGSEDSTEEPLLDLMDASIEEALKEL